MYSAMYVFVKVHAIGHACVGFGNSGGPQIVFNQDGADGNGPSFGDRYARLSRFSWETAKSHFIVGNDIYHAYVVQNSKVMDAFNYADEIFENSPERPGEDSNYYRNRVSNILNQNCATLTKDVAQKCGIWTFVPGAFTPLDVFNAMGRADILYSDVSQWGVLRRQDGKVTFTRNWGAIPQLN